MLRIQLQLILATSASAVEHAVSEQALAEDLDALSDVWLTWWAAPAGCLCSVLAWSLTRSCTSPQSYRPKNAHLAGKLPGQNWWIQVRSADTADFWLCLGASLVSSVLVIVVALAMPASGAPVGVALFLFAASLDLLLLPIVSATVEACVLKRASRTSSGRAHAVLALCPALVDFSHCHLPWFCGCSQDKLLAHWAEASEEWLLLESTRPGPGQGPGQGKEAPRRRGPLTQPMP